MVISCSCILLLLTIWQKSSGDRAFNLRLGEVDICLNNHTDTAVAKLSYVI